MDWLEDSSGVLAALFGLLSTVFGLFYIKEKNATNKEAVFRDDILKEIQFLREENNALKEKYEESIRQMSELKLQFAILEQEWKLKIQMFESAHNDLPIPMWLKDENGKILSINGAYERIFLNPRGYEKNDYVYDSDVWPAEIAEQFGKHDKQVLRDKTTWVGYEKVPDKNDVIHEWMIIKFVRYANGIVLGIGGIAVPKMKEDITDGE